MSLSNKALSAGTPGHLEGSVVISATVVVASLPIVLMLVGLEELGFLELGFWFVDVDIRDESWYETDSLDNASRTALAALLLVHNFFISIESESDNDW